MKFLNPNGFWLLLGIPILIIIYLIKTQHEDRAVSSTYIWQLSKKFSKKRLPLQKFKRFLLILLQLLMIVTASFLVARPYVYDGTVTDYIVILDSSASMRMEDEKGISRYERALKDISELNEELAGGHTVSLILAGEQASCVLQNTTSQSEFQRILKNASCGLGTCNVGAGVKLAQDLSDKSKNPKVLFFTDQDFAAAENVTVINMDQKEWNASVTALSCTFQDGNALFSGKLISKGRDAVLTVGLKVDDRIVSAQKLECADGEQVTVDFTVEGLSRFDSATLYFEENDRFTEDNSYSFCTGNGYTRKVLLASASPLYLQSALEALGNCTVTTVSTLEDVPLSGYGLYLFDGIYPETYPTDGSVIQFGSEKLPEGLSAGETMEEESDIWVDQIEGVDICTGVTFRDVVLSKYVELRGDPTWESLFSCTGVSVARTKQISGGIYATVFSFDLHDSNLPMMSDYMLLMKNLVNYSAPDVLKKTDCSVGESVEVYLLPLAEHCYLKTPDGKITLLLTEGRSYTVLPDAVGVYTVLQTIGDGGVYADFFAHVPLNELDMTQGEAISITMTEASTDAIDAINELWIWFAALLLLLVLAEWGVYYHDRY